VRRSRARADLPQQVRLAQNLQADAKLVARAVPLVEDAIPTLFERNLLLGLLALRLVFLSRHLDRRMIQIPALVYAAAKRHRLGDIDPRERIVLLGGPAEFDRWLLGVHLDLLPRHGELLAVHNRLLAAIGFGEVDLAAVRREHGFLKEGMDPPFTFLQMRIDALQLGAAP